jgi:hypothetical protein
MCCQTLVSVTVETTLSKRIYIYLLPVLLLLSLTAHAQWSEIPSGNLDSRTARIQAKAESLYQSGGWERAHFIYVNELAPIGDKYAQYMAGYMCQWGHGVPKDPVMASAWYRVAAERDSPEFVEVRDEMLGSLSQEQRDRSDIEYIRLRQQFSDMVVVMNLLSGEFAELQDGGTGSRLSRRGGSVTIVDPRSGAGVSKDALDKRILEQMQVRLDYLTGELGIVRIEADDLDRDALDALNTQVMEFLSIVDDR